MKHHRKQPTEFIIQNFRSWSGKNYFRLSDINFLFGGNSSGKSSIIAAISLLKQSFASEQGHRCIERLIGNGDSIGLGPINKQVNYNTPDFAPDWRDEMLAFGARYRDQSSINNIIASTSGIVPNKSRGKSNTSWKIDTLEACSYYNPMSGVLNAVELKVNMKSLLNIRHLNLTRQKSFNFEFTTDEKQIRNLTNRKHHDIDLLNIIFDPTIENMRPLPRIIRTQLDKITKDYYGAIIQLDDLKAFEGRHAEASRRLAEVEEKIGQLGSTYSAADLEASKSYLMQLTADWSNLNHQIHQKLGLKPPSSIPNAKSLEETIKTLVLKNLPFPTSLLMQWKDLDTAVSDLIENANFELRYDSELFDRILRNNQPNFENLFWGLLRNSGTAHSEDNTQKSLIMWNLFATIFCDLPDFTSILENTIYEAANLTANCDQIGPSRKLPPRVGVIDPYLAANDVGKAAENFLNLLHESDDETIILINEWMLKLELGYQISTSFASEFNIQRFGLLDGSENEVAIHDVGYGVSQVLPILMQLLLSRNKLITIEQPELHIHPRLQANLAELFIWSAEHLDNCLIIETHSEHIILRLQKLQREKSRSGTLDGHQKPLNIFEDVNIHVVEKLGDPAHSVCSTLKITSDGEFNGEWPGGFFEERYIEKGLI